MKNRVLRKGKNTIHDEEKYLLCPVDIMLNYPMVKSLRDDDVLAVGFWLWKDLRWDNSTGILHGLDIELRKKNEKA